ncbi:hypothetical protein GWO43_15555 [candidate division KSB1 bacterium]|nr:hypothetical protein [candidate division KSB1 bacterium]NIR68430.1 hypothetical protein [candidate division KSB1 bacterium]NIS25382.1 hypothetical protein [candidate division KSB1 bacterium]NIT72259.1 hypothetical protein [candidate division KSB1 bacterium]NIU26064.1 hypothetical protein [candidate division KSB1 bacterium]
MKRLSIIILSLILMTGQALSQNIIEQESLLRMMPVYQSWMLDDADDFSEVTVPLSIYYPVNRNFSVTLRGNQASATGDNMETISGLTDTQLNLSYYLEPANVVLDLGLNLPSGQTKLDTSEFRTSTVISNNIFDMRTPNFGQGLNVSAGFTWAVPISEALVFGLGASYQLKGNFTPRNDFVEHYKPGDEILVTGGFDARLSPTTTLSADVIFTTFATDKLGEADIFAPGNRIVINAQFRKYFNFNEFWLFARYRSRDKNELAIFLGEPLFTESERTFPNQLEIMSHYRMRFSPTITTRLLFEARFYQEAPGFESFQTTLTSAGINLFGFGIAPEFALNRSLNLPIVLKYFLGSFDEGPNLTGLEIGSGLTLTF